MQDNNLIDVNLTSEMKTSFIDYAMSVIVARALPDVRDGLKPVSQGMLWVNTTHTVIPLFMKPWFGWRNGGVIATC